MANHKKASERRDHRLMVALTKRDANKIKRSAKRENRSISSFIEQIVVKSL